jgi:hypothetical protein
LLKSSVIAVSEAWPARGRQQPVVGHTGHPDFLVAESKGMPRTERSSALLTDLYQINRMQAYLDRGATDTAVFELFARNLPSRRGALVLFSGMVTRLETICPIAIFSGAMRMRVDRRLINPSQHWVLTGALVTGLWRDHSRMGLPRHRADFPNNPLRVKSRSVGPDQTVEALDFYPCHATAEYHQAAFKCVWCRGCGPKRARSLI